MEFIQKNWDLFSIHPWLFVTLALMFFILGWKAATLFYKERIELLKEKNNGEKPIIPEPEGFEYPQSGRYGKNILSNSVISIKKNDKVALRAQIPLKSILLIEIKGPAPLNKNDHDGSWCFNLSKRLNWTISMYEFENGGRQEFTAEAGIADMELKFVRCGEVAIVAYEDDDRNISWEKTITIREK